jgi:hypothetical protein
MQCPKCQAEVAEGHFYGFEEWTRRLRVKNKRQVEINASMKKKGSP